EASNTPAAIKTIDSRTAISGFDFLAIPACGRVNPGGHSYRGSLLPLCELTTPNRNCSRIPRRIYLEGDWRGDSVDQEVSRGWSVECIQPGEHVDRCCQCLDRRVQSVVFRRNPDQGKG